MLGQTTSWWVKQRNVGNRQRHVGTNNVMLGQTTFCWDKQRHVGTNNVMLGQTTSC